MMFWKRLSKVKEMRKSVDEQLLDFERAERIAREQRISDIRRAKINASSSKLHLVERETIEDINSDKKSSNI